MSSMSTKELKKEIQRLDAEIKTLETSAKESVKSVQKKTQWMNPVYKNVKANPAPWLLGGILMGVVVTQALKSGSKKSNSTANSTARAKDATLMGLVGIELKRWAAKEAISYMKDLANKKRSS